MSEEIPGRQTKVLDKQLLRTFLLGGAAGILAGILLAPRSGKELRGSVMERAGEARERGRETLFEARERMQERLSEVREGPRPDPSHPHPEDVAPQRPTHLRDVSRSVEEPVERDAERSEELRRKVRETRARLKGRIDGPRPVGEDRDPGPDR
jgi:gas vesicle protein